MKPFTKPYEKKRGFKPAGFGVSKIVCPRACGGRFHPTERGTLMKKNMQKSTNLGVFRGWFHKVLSAFPSFFIPWTAMFLG